MSDVNEKWLKIGKIPVSTSVPLDGAVQLTVHGENEIYYFTCVKVENKTNNDGTHDEIYILKHDG